MDIITAIAAYKSIPTDTGPPSPLSRHSVNMSSGGRFSAHADPTPLALRLLDGLQDCDVNYRTLDPIMWPFVKLHRRLAHRRSKRSSALTPAAWDARPLKRLVTAFNRELLSPLATMRATSSTCDRQPTPNRAAGWNKLSKFLASDSAHMSWFVRQSCSSLQCTWF